MAEQGERARISRAALSMVADRDLAVEQAAYDLVDTSDHDELTEAQKALSLAAQYAADIDNGGHLQYFSNKEIGQAKAVIAALERVGAAEQAEIFRVASAFARAHPVEQYMSVDAYCERAELEEFSGWDDDYRRCAADLARVVLPAFIKANEAEFVEFVD